MRHWISTLVLLFLAAPVVFAQNADSSTQRNVQRDRTFEVASSSMTGTTGELLVDGDAPSAHAASGVFLGALGSSSPDIHAKLGATTSDAEFSVFNSADTSLLAVRADGRVGIGTLSPVTRLHVLNDTTLFALIEATSASQNAGVQVKNANRQWQLYINGADSDKFQIRTYSAVTGGSNPVTIDTSGNVGIGTTAPDAGVRLHIVGNLKVQGDITGTKVIGAVYQDVAEWVPATADLTPGTVVVLNPAKTNEVMASHAAYDTGVAGVVSAQPGVILGVEGEGKEQIATTGRVKVRVDARAHAIRVGDLLVTSDVAGTAMKSQPVQIDGQPFHRPGTIVGKALEPLENGVGEILVLLSLQ